MMRRLRRVWWFVSGSRCQHCGEPVPSTELTAGWCPECIVEVREWLASIGAVVTVPQGWRWPK